MDNQFVEQTAIKKICWRILPLTFLIYILCYIDRINVGFAALTMNNDIGIDTWIYGVSSTIFYVGYVLFEIPSNLLMHKFGARIWIARIMISWGIASAMTAAIVGPTSLLLVRFFVGIGEAGLFPGIILYFSYWFPDKIRGRVIGFFLLSLPAAMALAGPISTFILGLDGWLGLKGWQLIFLFEGIPTIIVGLILLKIITDTPRDASWLSFEEKKWLVSLLEEERRNKESIQVYSAYSGITDIKILLLGFINIFLNTVSISFALFVPLIFKSTGLSNMQVGYVTFAAYILGSFSTVLFAYLSDIYQNRLLFSMIACLLSFVGLVIAGCTDGSYWPIFGLCIATSGIYGAKAPFWAIPSMLLTGIGAAAGIGLVNSVGNIGGIIGPAAIGFLRSYTGNYSISLLLLAFLNILTILMFIIVRQLTVNSSQKI